MSIKEIILKLYIFLIPSIIFSQTYEIADEYWDKAMKFQKQGKYLESVEMFKKSADAFILCPNQDSLSIIKALNATGYFYSILGNHVSALENFLEALNYANSESHKKEIAVLYNSIAQSYCSIGEYNLSVKYSNEALIINKEINNIMGIANCLTTLGVIYKIWGKLDLALDYYQQSLALIEQYHVDEYIAVIKNNIGEVYRSKKEYNKALDYFNEALNINKKINNDKGIALNLNNLGTTYNFIEKPDVAMTYLNESLKISKELGLQQYVFGCLNNMGGSCYFDGNYEKAIDYFMEALMISENLGMEYQVAGGLYNIGAIYYLLGDYLNAIQYLQKAIEKFEDMRIKAIGNIKRDFLQSILCSYQYLLSAYINNNEADNAFYISELSSAKYLAEQLAGDEKNETFDLIHKSDIINTNTGIIKFANMDWESSARIVIHDNNIDAVEIDQNIYLSKLGKQYMQKADSMYIKFRGTKPLQSDYEDLSGYIKIKETSNFENLEKTINYYRYLLTNPNKSDDKKEEFIYISKVLYELLFSDIEPYIKDKNELVILPDGILAYLPFETLIMPDGRYLCEKYKIKYQYSLTISNIISNRNYSSNRKSLLAIGGAVYKEETYVRDMNISPYQIKSYQKDVFIALDRGDNDFSDSYQRLGYSSFGNLPGTLEEVNTINKIIPSSKILTGNNANETSIKELSNNGGLSNYKVLHFATHGLVVPEIPELSAIILSQDVDSLNDGYLRMQEIADLNIQADFVNLSACETGLGKIYGGEGVVGLTQSFLIAGANGLSVSLWQVADISTKEFMIALYKKVQNDNESYFDAMYNTKIEFINGIYGEKYKDPYFWAPFVYYGN